MLKVSKLAAAVAFAAGGLTLQAAGASAMPALDPHPAQAARADGEAERVQFYYGRPYGYYHRPYYGYRRPFGYYHRPFFGGYGYRRHFGYGGYGYHHGYRHFY